MIADSAKIIPRSPAKFHSIYIDTGHDKTTTTGSRHTRNLVSRQPQQLLMKFTFHGKHGKLVIMLFSVTKVIFWYDETFKPLNHVRVISHTKGVK